jgi:WD40 repeat protein
MVSKNIQIMKSLFNKQIYSALFLLISIFFLSCKKENNIITPEPIVVKPDQVFFGINSANQLIQYNANAVETAQSTKTITGIAGGETVLAIDFRPATGELYAVTSGSRIYVINTSTGAARAIGSAPFSPALSGSVGFDFNPTVDRIRLVTSSGQNLRVNPETGAAVSTDGNINGPATVTISGVAYSGNTAGSANTVLYDIDITTQKLYRQTPPNAGTLVEIGSLGVVATGENGFDISPDGTVALASLNVGGQTNLYRVDTATGKVSLLGKFSTGNITSIAIPTKPVAYALDDMNNLVIFDPTNTAITISKAITGLSAGEILLGLDFRPLNGQLYALGSTSRLYTINASSGAATAVGTVPLITLLNGTNFGFDFNPTVDRIRVVSDLGQNLRLHPDLGTIASVDGNLNPGTPNISAAAYTNNFAGAATTTLFVIDYTTDKLYMQNPPNTGTLVEVGSLGINIDAVGGFDIGSTSGTAFGLFKIGASQGLYSINLTTGAATKVSDYSKPVRGFTIGLGF